MPGKDLEYLVTLDHGFDSNKQLLVTISDDCLEVEHEDERDWKGGIEDNLLFWECFKRKILARQITQRNGKVRWAKAIWMVFTKHLRQTTLWPQGYVCITAFAFTQITHCNKIMKLLSFLNKNQIAFNRIFQILRKYTILNFVLFCMHRRNSFCPYNSSIYHLFLFFLLQNLFNSFLTFSIFLLTQFLI